MDSNYSSPLASSPAQSQGNTSGIAPLASSAVPSSSQFSTPSTYTSPLATSVSPAKNSTPTNTDSSSPYVSPLGSKSIAPSSSQPQKSSITPAQPQPSPYFSTTTSSGASIGFSDQKDVSGIPYFAYRNPGDTSTTTDLTRVAFRTNPNAATTTPANDIETPRMSEAASQAERTQMGATADQQLDHRMALSLGGSNNPANLKPIPTAQNQAFGKGEVQDLHSVEQGQETPFQAQVNEAERKGLPMPWTGTKASPSAISNFLSAMESAGKTIYNKVTGLFEKPSDAVAKNTLPKPEVDPHIAFAEMMKNFEPSAVSNPQSLAGQMENFIAATPQSTAEALTNFAQGFPRMFAQLGVSLTQAVLAHTKYSQAAQDPIQFSKILQPIFGNQPVEGLANDVVNLQNIIQSSSFAQKTGLAKFASPLAFGGIVGGETLNFLPGGEGEESFISQLAKEDDPVKVSLLLQSKGMPKPYADDMAPYLADMTDKKDVRMTLETYKAMEGTIKALPTLEKSNTENPPEPINNNLPSNEERTQNVLNGKNTPDTPPIIQKEESSGNEIGNKNIPDTIPASRFKTSEDLINYVSRQGSGRGARLNVTEMRQLVQHLVDQGEDNKIIQTWGGSVKRGTIYKSYGGGLDIVLGKVTDQRFGGDSMIVAQFDKNGKLDGKFRTHSTPIDPSRVVTKIDDNRLNQLGSGTSLPSINEDSNPSVTSENKTEKKFKRGTQYQPLGRGPKIETSQVANLLKGIIPPEKINYVFNPDLLKEEGLLGKFEGNDRMSYFNKNIRPIITLLDKEGETYVRTAFHEAYHYLENKVFSPEFLRTLNTETLSKMTQGDHDYYTNLDPKMYNTPELRASEYRADEFAKTETEKAGYKSPIQTIIDKVKAAIQKIIDAVNNIVQRIKETPNKQGGFAKNPLAEDEEPLDQQKTKKDYLAEAKANADYTKQIQKEELQNIKNNPNLEELKTKRQTLYDALQQHPARELARNINPRTGELPEQGYDEKAADAGYKSLEDARAGVKDYKGLQKQYADSNKAVMDATKASREAHNTVAERVAEEKSLDNSAKHISDQIGGKTTKEQRIARIKDAELASRQKIKEEQDALARRDTQVRQAEIDATKKKNFWDKFKEETAPLSKVDPRTKNIYDIYRRDHLLADEKGREVMLNLRGKEMSSDMNTIHEQQAGAKIPWITNFFEDKYTEAKRLGIDVPHRENYFPQLYANPEHFAEAIEAYLKDRGLDQTTIDDLTKRDIPLSPELALKLKLNPDFAKERTFPDFKTAEQYGMVPKWNNPVPYMAWYEAHLAHVEANLDFEDSLLKEGKIMPSDVAPKTWKTIKMPGSDYEYKTSSPLAKVISNILPTGDTNFMEDIVHATGVLSGTIQEAVLSGGVANVHFFSIGQLEKTIATGIGDVVSGKWTSLPEDLKQGAAFLKTNFTAPTLDWMDEKQPWFKKMANQGIDTSSRVGGINHQTWGDILAHLKRSGGLTDITGVTADSFHKIFGEKTFNGFIPMMLETTFEAAYKKGVAGGMLPEIAEKFAGDLTKNNYGILEDMASPRWWKDLKQTLFLAQKFRGGMVNFFLNDLKSINPLQLPWESSGGAELYDENGNKISTLESPTKSFRNPFTSKNILDPRLARNRSFVVGAAVLYIAYNMLNKKTTGHYMFQNAPGDEFNLMVPVSPSKALPGSKQGDISKIPFLASIFTVPRLIMGSAIDMAKGNLPAVTQQLGGLGSIPVQLVTEFFNNQNYFGNKIYDPTLPNGVYNPANLKKIGVFLGAGASPPYIAALASILNNKTPIYQATTQALALPIKYTTVDKMNQASAYNAVADQTANSNEIYSQVQSIAIQLANTEKSQGHQAAVNQFNQIAKQNPALAKAIVSAITEKQLGTDAVLKQLDVTNGARAAEIVKEVNAFSQPADRKAFLVRLWQEKILTKTVLNQVIKIMQ